MIVKAIYMPTGKECYLNTDYIVDIFKENGWHIAYVLDDGRGGYFLDNATVKKLERGSEENDS